jgi:signal transduction histidine kinase
MTDPGSERLAILVHEVRSPVAALSAVAEALPDIDDVAARRELVRLALGACSAIERIVTDVAVASVRAASVDVAALVRDAVAERAVSGAAVRAEVDAELPLIQGDAVRLRQALDNLVTNALYHGAGAVVVRATRSDDGISVAVADDGEGIPPEDLERIFEAGVRLDDSQLGSGLGLALARSLVEAHGGTLRVDSHLGRGSTFTIVLPASHPDT